jgi:hypothetical protein
MSTRPYATTNQRIADALAVIDELIGWAQADAEHAAENDAMETAKDDRWRAMTLHKARVLIEKCQR